MAEQGLSEPTSRLHLQGPGAAAALEEGVVNMNTTFTCTGSIHVEGWGKAINCSKRAGHGTQT